MQRQTTCRQSLLKWDSVTRRRIVRYSITHYLDHRLTQCITVVKRKPEAKRWQSMLPVQAKFSQPELLTCGRRKGGLPTALPWNPWSAKRYQTECLTSLVRVYPDFWPHNLSSPAPVQRSPADNRLFIARSRPDKFRGEGHVAVEGVRLKSVIFFAFSFNKT